MKKLSATEYIGLAAKHLAANGLSWSYHCYVDYKTEEDNCDDKYGEGEMIIYYAGYTCPKDSHCRLMFCDDDHGDIVLLATMGTQGPGHHFVFPQMASPTEEELRLIIEQMANYLKLVRVPQ